MPPSPRLSVHSSHPGISKAQAILLIGFLLLIAAILWRVVVMMTPPPNQGPPVFRVHTQNPVVQPVAITYTTRGTVEANRRVDLNAEVAATITAILVEEGQAVRKGQLLMRLKAAKQHAQQQQSAASVSAARQELVLTQAEIAEARANVEAAAARKTLAESEWHRYENLYAQALVSALERDQKKTAYTTAVANDTVARKRLSVAEARLVQAGSQVEAASAQQSYQRALTAETRITAPFTGRVGQRYVDEGDQVQPIVDKLITVVDGGRLKVAFTVPERYMSQIKTGLPVTLTVEGLANQTFAGQVIFVDPVVDMANRTLTAKAQLEDTARDFLRDGQFAQVTLTLATRPAALVLPEAAIIPRGEAFYVYKMVEGIARFEPITLGERLTNAVEVVTGVAADDDIIVDGLQNIFDGAPVENVVPHQPTTKTPESPR